MEGGILSAKIGPGLRWQLAEAARRAVPSAARLNHGSCQQAGMVRQVTMPAGSSLKPSGSVSACEEPVDRRLPVAPD
eukprot:13258220-Alexandrium_andersonii.AAC.1